MWRRLMAVSGVAVFGAAVLALSGGCAQARGAAADGSASGGERFEIPLRLENARPYVDVFVNGEGPFNFLIDTGASGEGRIDAAPAAQLGAAVVGTVENSDSVNVAQQNVVQVDRISVGGFARSDVALMTRDYNPPSRDPALARLDGILGLEFFDGWVATIDSPRKRLVLERGALDAEDAHVVAMLEWNQIPMTIDGEAHVCSIDTGSVLTAHFPLSMSGALVAGELEDAGSGRRANTTFTLKRGRVGPALEFAGNRVEGVEAMFSDRAPEINIGAGILSRFAVSVDARNRLFRIAPEAPGAGVIVRGASGGE